MLGRKHANEGYRRPHLLVALTAWVCVPLLLGACHSWPNFSSLSPQCRSDKAAVETLLTGRANVSQAHVYDCGAYEDYKGVIVEATMAEGTSGAEVDELIRQIEAVASQGETGESYRRPAAVIRWKRQGVDREADSIARLKTEEDLKKRSAALVVADSYVGGSVKRVRVANFRTVLKGGMVAEVEVERGSDSGVPKDLVTDARELPEGVVLTQTFGNETWEARVILASGQALPQLPLDEVLSVVMNVGTRFGSAEKPYEVSLLVGGVETWLYTEEGISLGVGLPEGTTSEEFEAMQTELFDLLDKKKGFDHAEVCWENNYGNGNPNMCRSWPNE